jgi:hypothetical protein
MHLRQVVISSKYTWRPPLLLTHLHVLSRIQRSLSSEPLEASHPFEN